MSEINTTQWKVPFFTIWIGQAFSLLGSMLVQFALVWWLTEETGSATVLAMASLVAMLPGVVVGPFAGALVDRWDRRRVMIVADSSIALVTLGLAVIYALGLMQPWHIYLAMFLRAIGGMFHWPAMQASTSLMVPKAQLARIAGMNQTLQGVMNILAPPLGALLLSILPLQGILVIDVGTALLAVLPLLFIAIPQPPGSPEASGTKFNLFVDVYWGFKYIWNWKGLFLVLILATLINFLLTPGFSLLPLLVTKHFGGEAIQLGWMNSAWGIGIIAGGLILSIWAGFKHRIHTTLLGLVSIGVGTLALGLSPANAFGWALAAMVFSGIATPITNGPLMALLQELVAPEMQGRVFTTVHSLAALMSPLGLAIAGPLSDRLGIQSWFIVGGIGCLVMGIGAFFIPTIVRLEDERHLQAAVIEERSVLNPAD